MIRVLAQELGFETCEWIEPRTQPWTATSWEDTASLPEQHGYESRASQFESFLRSSLRTLSLCIAGTQVQTNATRRRLVLLDDMAPALGADGDSPLQRQQARRGIPCPHPILADTDWHALDTGAPA